ncbi:MAG: hypothetical protein AAFY71_13670 [Bacteroidota bacterium]
MEQSILNPSWDFENLLRTKDFYSLSEEEREDVLAELTEEEYQQMRELVLFSGELLKETQPSLTPRANIRQNLNEHFHSKQKRAKIVSFLKHPLPVWQVAAAAILLLLSVQFFSNGNLLNVPGVDEHHQITDSTGLDTAIKVGYMHTGHTGGDSLFTSMDSL